VSDIHHICTDYLKVCSNNKNLSKHTLKAYKIDFEQFQKCIGMKIDITSINKKHITKFHDYLLNLELAPSSIKRKLVSLKAMFKWLELEEVILVTPFNKIRTNIKLPKSLPRNVPASKLHKLIKKSKSELGIKNCELYCTQEISSLVTTKKSLNKLTVLIAIELMLCTGMRVCELSGIELSSIDIAERKIKLLGKGSRERFVYLPDIETCQLVESYLLTRLIVNPETDTFLVNSRGQPASTQFIRKILRALAQRSSIEMHVTPHMLRHSAACELIESGLDIRFVQRLLGHSSISTTEIYTHVSDTLLRDKISQANIRERVMKK
jgi:integrase/recombinase XerD